MTTQLTRAQLEALRMVARYSVTRFAEWAGTGYAWQVNGLSKSIAQRTIAKLLAPPKPLVKFELVGSATHLLQITPAGRAVLASTERAE